MLLPVPVLLPRAVPGRRVRALPPTPRGASEGAAPTAAEPASEPGLRSGMPIASAASCSHCGGLSKKDVASRSTRRGGASAASDTESSTAPYSSSYRRITSPTGSPGHSVVSPLSRAMTSRTRPPSPVGPPPELDAWEVPPSRSSDQATKPRSNSRTRTSRWR
ncbi:hypothetical protein GCM10020000_48310 [Streptomyces olivoverticillatus]